MLPKKYSAVELVFPFCPRFLYILRHKCPCYSLLTPPVLPLLLRIAALLKPFGNRFAAAGGKEPPTEGQWTASFLGRSFFPIF